MRESDMFEENISEEEKEIKSNIETILAKILTSVQSNLDLPNVRQHANITEWSKLNKDSLAEINTTAEETLIKATELEQKVFNVNTELGILRNYFNKVLHDNKLLKSQMMWAKVYSRYDNLIFTGIHTGETWWKLSGNHI